MKRAYGFAILAMVAAIFGSGCEFPVRGDMPSGAVPKGSSGSSGAAAATPTASKIVAPIVQPVAPFSIQYPNVPKTLTVGVAVSLKPLFKGGLPGEIGVEPALPDGLALDPGTGEIKGIPTEKSEAQDYVVTALSQKDTPDTATATLALSVAVDPKSVPGYKLAELALVVGAPMAEVGPAVAAPQGSTFSVAPALPASLTLDTEQGTISGTPKAALEPTVFTFTVTSPGGEQLSEEKITISAGIVVEASAAGRSGACARLSTGRVSCWQGPGPAQHVADLSGATAVAAGIWQACAIVGTDGAVRCWESPGQSHEIPLANGKVLRGARALAIGEHHSCALLGDDVYCWGYSGSGQLGVKRPQLQPGAVRIAGLHGRARAIGAGGLHTCAVTGDEGSVECWGAVLEGDPKLPPVLVPAKVEGVRDAAAVAVGRTHACALEGATRALRCWGRNSHGQLGAGNAEKVATPITVSGLAGKASGVAVGERFTCAAILGGDAQCWGAGERAQLGFPAGDTCKQD
ncbi:MAG: putative Ig domain-containing protein, partial [Deltaproteobacteria bacterium]|nr:putative Ig domain-containing protein [Deltaproteobacteria bacterium]